MKLPATRLYLLVYLLCAPACLACIFFRIDRWINVALGIAAALAHYEMSLLMGVPGRVSVFERVLGGVVGAVDGLLISAISYWLVVGAPFYPNLSLVIPIAMGTFAGAMVGVIKPKWVGISTLLGGMPT